MPEETADGIRKLIDTTRGARKPLTVLNMSELTPLAITLHYTPPINQPCGII